MANSFGGLSNALLAQNSILEKSPYIEICHENLVLQVVAVIHGGAWDIPVELRPAHKNGLVTAFDEAIVSLRRDLQQGITALQELGANAICNAIVQLENNEVYDAGFGSFLNEVGEVELDAGFMRGDGLVAGAVAAMGAFANPICVARRVATCTPHVLLVGEGANAFALSQGFVPLHPHALVHPRELAAHKQWLAQGRPNAQSYFSSQQSGSHAGSEPEKRGTVGMVLALRLLESGSTVDRCGGENELLSKQPGANWQLFAGTSTGGTPGKMRGRVGDVPVPGAGFYADNCGAAVSATGWGEGFLRTLPAKRVNDLCAAGMHPQEACTMALQEVFAKTGGRGGLIAVSAEGLVGCAFSTPDMAVRVNTFAALKL